MTEYRYIGQVAMSLEGGAPMAPGDFIELSDEELEGSYYKTMLEEGMLLNMEDLPEATPPEEEPDDEEPAPKSASRKAAQKKEE